MKNPEQGSRTEMVRQSAQIFPAPTTINAPLTPRQAERAAQFLAMLTPKAVPDVAEAQPQEQAAPRCRSYQELAAERAARDRERLLSETRKMAAFGVKRGRDDGDDARRARRKGHRGQVVNAADEEERMQRMEREREAARYD